MKMILETNEVSKHFGGINAVEDLSFGIEEGSFMGMIGPNGSGKTTSVNLVMGVYRPDKGKITLDGKDITHKKTNAIVKMGIARTHQLLTIYTKLTVLQNMKIAQLPFLRFQSEEKLNEKMKEVMNRLDLSSKAERTVSLLSLYDQKKLDIAMRIMTSPKLLILDEPVGGLTATEVGELTKFLLEERSKGQTCMIIEHTMKAIEDLCNRVVVLNEGKKIAEGSVADVLADEGVKKAYLGG